jgi:monofunctional biosynthetic peptidoglycan transglycosylase
MGKWILRILLILLGLVLTLVAWLYFTLPDVSQLVKNNPQTTAIIEQRIQEADISGKKLSIRQKWVSFAKFPRLLKRTVRITEDANFYNHEGIDVDELKEAIIKNWEEGRVVRGGSTISQQVAKNLYLSTSRSIFRKIREYFITRRLEATLSKNRIFHIYLNIIELGPGIFGMEAASQYYFGKSVSNLNLEEMVRLTAVIPRPLIIKPNRKSKWLFWKCCWITEKLLLYKYIDQATFLLLQAKFC